MWGCREWRKEREYAREKPLKWVEAWQCQYIIVKQRMSQGSKCGCLGLGEPHSKPCTGAAALPLFHVQVRSQISGGWPRPLPATAAQDCQ